MVELLFILAVLGLIGIVIYIDRRDNPEVEDDIERD